MEEVKLRVLELFRYIHACFNQVLNLFWQAVSYLVNSWHLIKSLAVSVFQSTKEQQDNFYVGFAYSDKKTFPPCSFLIPHTAQMISLNNISV